MDALRQRLREAEGDLGKKVGDLRAGLVPLLGQMPEAAEAEAKVVAALQDSQSLLQQQTKKCQDMQNGIGVAVAKKAAAEAELQRLQQEDGRIAAELGVPSATSGASHSSAANEFKARLQDVKQQIELARKDVSMTESAKHMYEKFREKSRSKNICQFCKRAFCGDGDIATFEDAMEKLIAKIPGFLESSHQKLSEVQSQETALESQRPRWDRLEQLRKDEVPRRQKELQPAMEEGSAGLRHRILYDAKYTMTKWPSALTVPSRSGTARNSKAPFDKAPASPVLARNPSLRGSIWAGLATKGKTMLLMDMLYGVQLTQGSVTNQKVIPGGASTTRTPCPSKCLLGSASTSTSRRF